MVVTQKQLKAKKAKSFYVKEDNKKRKFMSQADAILDNARIKKDRDEIEDLKRKQAERRIEQNVASVVNDAPDDAPDDAPVELQGPAEDTTELSEDKMKEINKIMKKIEGVSGKPGAVQKRKEYLAKIEEIKQS